MLNEHVKQFLVSYYAGNRNDVLDYVLDYLREEETVHIGKEYKRRHWREFERIVRVGENYIQFIDAAADGDWSADDKGWEFDESTIKIVEPYQETIVVTKYRAI